MTVGGSDIPAKQQDDHSNIGVNNLKLLPQMVQPIANPFHLCPDL